MNIITIPPTPPRAATPPTEVVVAADSGLEINHRKICLENTSDDKQEDDPEIIVSSEEPASNEDIFDTPASIDASSVTMTTTMRSLSGNNSSGSASSLKEIKNNKRRKPSRESLLVGKNVGSCHPGSSIFSRILFVFGWIYSCLRFSFVVLQNLYHIPTYLFFNWIVFYPVYFFKPSWFLFLENIAYNLCLYTVGSWSWLANIQVIECGDDIYGLKDQIDAAAKREKKRLKSRKNSDHKRPRDLIYKEKVPTDDLSPASTNSSSIVLSPQQQQQSLGNNNTSSIEEGDQHEQQSNGHLLLSSQNNSLHSSSIQSLNAKNNHMTSNTTSTLIDLGSPVRDNVSLDVASNDKNDNHPKHFNSKVSPLTPSSSSVSLSSLSPSKGRVLLMANHQCTSDVPLMFQAFVAKAKYVLLWVMDYQFKYTNFGVVSGTHGDFFITPKTFVKSELTKHCLSNPDKELVILFPEGGFRYKRAESSDRYAEKKGLPKLSHLTWPRTGAFLDLTEGNLGMTHIIDLTILYLSQRQCCTIMDIALGRNSQPIYFYYRIFEVQPDVAYDENWLNQRWLEKEELMKSFYEDPEEFLRTKAGQLRPVKLSLIRLIGNQLCILIACFIMYLVVKYLLSIFIH